MTASNTRYFYADPLAAAWMAKHFGMKIRAENSETGDYWPGVIEWDRIILEWRDYDRFYIYQESLTLLEPQIGDVIKQWADPDHRLIYDIGERSGKPVYFLRDGSYNFFESIERIIQRDGKPFHWPQSEPSA